MFVSATRWQLYVLYAAAYLVFSVSVIACGLSHGIPAGTDWKAVAVPWICGVLLVLGQAGWVLSAGLFLNALLKPALRMRDGFFRFSLAFGLISVLTWPLLVLNSNPVVTRVTIGVYIVALVCMLYSMEFLAKALAMTITGKRSLFPDHARYYVGIVVSPLSLWRLQPRLNQLYAQHPNFQLTLD
jgi:hypothetical protein